MKLNVGDEVEFIGDGYGGCGETPCKDCFIKHSGDHLIVENTNDSDDDEDGFGNRTIKIRQLDSNGQSKNTCIVDARDLRVIKAKKITNWRQRIR